jgi:serine/threonine protein kinase
MTRVLARGELSDVYLASRAGESVALKASASFEEADLLEHEAEILRHLVPDGTPDEKFYRYLPRLLDSFLFEELAAPRAPCAHRAAFFGSLAAPRAPRRANVLPAFDDYVSLEDLHLWHGVLDFRDAAWMFKRVLAALGFVHRAGLVHGAVLPAHVLVHPVHHGARLVDWCYAAERGERVRAASVDARALVAPEILGKRAVGPQTDIYMLAASIARVLGGTPGEARLPTNVPAPFARFVFSCMAEREARRPDDAWALHEELDDVLLRLGLNATYRPLPTERRPHHGRQPLE